MKKSQFPRTMKKSLFFLQLFITFIGYSYAQLPIRYTDTLGFKQGEWYEYRVDPLEIKVTGDLTYTSDSIVKHIGNYRIIGNRFKKYNIFKQVGSYKNGLRNGTWFEYWPDGPLYKKVNYNDGILVGKCYIYHKNGRVKSEYEIIYGHQSNVKFYKKNGALYKEMIFEPQDQLRHFLEF